jgi:hypothetical protein
VKNHWIERSKNKKMVETLSSLDLYYHLQYVQNEIVNDTRNKISRLSFYSSFKNNAQFITGTVYNNGVAIQTFVVESDGKAIFTAIGHQSVKVIRGWFDKEENCLKFVWSSYFHNSYAVCNYEYDYFCN